MTTNYFKDLQDRFASVHEELDTIEYEIGIIKKKFTNKECNIDILEDELITLEHRFDVANSRLSALREEEKLLCSDSEYIKLKETYGITFK